MGIKVLKLLLGGKLNEIVLLQNDYLHQENQLYKKKYGRIKKLNDQEKRLLSAKARKISQYGRKYFDEICTLWRPETILGWYKKILRKAHTYEVKNKRSGRPRVQDSIERKTVSIARENRGWGYTSIMGALRNAGHVVCRSTVKRIP